VRFATLAVALGVCCLASRAVAVSASPNGGSIPPGVRKCATYTSRAPGLGVLLDRTRRTLGDADGIQRVRIDAPPRFYWGRSYPPTHTPITRRSLWVYITIRSVGNQGDAASVVSQRGVWEADLLVQALHAAVCATGQRAEAGYSLVTPTGQRSPAAESGGAIQSLPRSYAWPFSAVGDTFRALLGQLSHRYDFRVTSLVVLHGLGDAPLVRVQSDNPKAFIRDLPAIESSLFPPVSDCWTSPVCFNGERLEAFDSNGQPFVATDGAQAIGTGVGGWGGQWVRKGLPYPFPTLSPAPPTSP